MDTVLLGVIVVLLLEQFYAREYRAIRYRRVQLGKWLKRVTHWRRR